MYKVIFTKYSLEDLNFIKSYVWEYASFVVDKILYTISNLSYFPNIWFSKGDNIFEIIDWKYKFRIIYKIDKTRKIIYIVSIFKWKPGWK